MAGKVGLTFYRLPDMQYFKLLDQWPNLVTRGLQLLRECEDDSFTYTTYNAITDPVVSLFVSLVHRKDTIEGHKIKGNFECAAAYLSLILRVIEVSVASIPVYADRVLAGCGQTSQQHDRI